MDNRPWAIHTVIIDKSIPFEEALNSFHNIINNPKKKYYRVTKNSYRFRNIPKTKFIKTTFRTKKVNKDISIVFGVLMPEYKHLEGSGIGDFLKKGVEKVKDIFKPTYKLNNISTKTLNQYGNKPISSMSVYRTPIQNIINIVLNLLSFGKFEEVKKKYGYDKLFHLALVCVINGKNIIVEKNEVINISTSYNVTNDTETMPVSTGGQILILNKMLENTKKIMGDTKFYQYDATDNNCQDFILAILNSNKINTPLVNSFVKQNTEELLKELPEYTSKVSRFLTDTGAIISRILGRSKNFKD